MLYPVDFFSAAEPSVGILPESLFQACLLRFFCLAGFCFTGFLFPVVGSPGWIFVLGFVPGSAEGSGWIVIPPQCRHLETLPAHTINYTMNFDRRFENDLPAFAASIGYRNLQDVDCCGRNILHLVMTGMKYCTLIAGIATTMFLPRSPRMPGDEAVALRQPITHGTPLGVTPLKLLCQDSDKNLWALEVVKAILEQRILPVTAFEMPDGPSVSVFLQNISYPLAGFYFPFFVICNVISMILGST